MKVNFMVIGAARSATTSICKILDSHPDICFSSVKEPQFFSNNDWRNNLNGYHKLFKRNNALLYGEGSTNYTKHPWFNNHIPRDIHEYNPDMKFIYVIRNPIDRILSHYKFALERGYTNSTISEAIKNNSIYIDTSKYMSQIKPYLEQFGRDQIQIIVFDDFKNNPQLVIDSICTFLKITPLNINSNQTHFNQTQKGYIGLKKYDHPKTFLGLLGKWKHIIQRKLKTHSDRPNFSLQPNEVQYITSQTRQEIMDIGKLINRDLSSWISQPPK